MPGVPPPNSDRTDQRPHGLFVGLATLDLIVEVGKLPGPNEKVRGSRRILCAGGPATNAALTFAHLGGRATLAAAVGRGPAADLVRTELAAAHVALIDLSPDALDALAIASILVQTRTGERSVVSAPGRTEVAISTPASSAATMADIMLADGHALVCARVCAAAAHQAGVPVVLDAGSWKPGLEDLLGLTDIALCSADFALPASARGDVLAELVTKGVAHAAVSHGGRPIEWRSGVTGAGTIQPPAVHAVDTLGAGDIWHGAFCWHWLHGRDFPGALAAAALVAAYSCEFFGPREWMAKRRR